jgi:hypothetical protein
MIVTWQDPPSLQQDILEMLRMEGGSDSVVPPSGSSLIC